MCAAVHLERVIGHSRRGLGRKAQRSPAADNCRPFHGARLSRQESLIEHRPARGWTLIFWPFHCLAVTSASRKSHLTKEARRRGVHWYAANERWTDALTSPCGQPSAPSRYLTRAAQTSLDFYDGPLSNAIGTLKSEDKRRHSELGSGDSLPHTPCHNHKNTQRAHSFRPNPRSKPALHQVQSLPAEFPYNVTTHGEAAAIRRNEPRMKCDTNYEWILHHGPLLRGKPNSRPGLTNSYSGWAVVEKNDERWTWEIYFHPRQKDKTGKLTQLIRVPYDTPRRRWKASTGRSPPTDEKW